MGRARKQPAIKQSKASFPEIELDEIDEILKELPGDESDQKVASQPVTIDTFQDRIIRQLERDVAETQAHLTSLTRRQERLAFSRQKAVNQDAVRFVLQRLNEQIVRSEARLQDLQRALTKEYRLAQCRTAIKEVEGELHRYRSMSPVLEQRLAQLQQELDYITGAHHQPSLMEGMKDQIQAMSESEQQPQPESSAMEQQPYAQSEAQPGSVDIQTGLTTAAAV